MPPNDLRLTPCDDPDRIARVRARCYAPRYADEQNHRKWLHFDRADPSAGEVLIASRDARDVGTASVYRGRMSVRGVEVDCQGVAWVGTTHDARRSGGVASCLVNRCLDLARGQGQVVSALMPFRVSYYDRFGYGLVERRSLWTIPLSLMPASQTPVRFLEPGDPQDRRLCETLRARQAAAGHADVHFPGANGFATWLDGITDDGYAFVGGEQDGEPWVVFGQPRWLDDAGRPVADGTPGAGFSVVSRWMLYTNPGQLADMLGFFGTLRDQYRSVQFATPADLPVNRLLRESQLPHRPVEHAHARCETIARMQVRILDHAAVLSVPPFPGADADGELTAAVVEPEGTTTHLRLRVRGGRCEAEPGTGTGTGDFSTDARTWAAVVFGDVSASTAVATGLAAGTPHATRLLDGFSRGPLPFCREYF